MFSILITTKGINEREKMPLQCHTKTAGTVDAKLNSS